MINRRKVNKYINWIGNSIIDNKDRGRLYHQ